MVDRSFFEAFETATDEPEAKPATTAAPSFAKAFESGTDAREPSVVTTLGSPITGAYVGAAEMLGAPVDVTAWALRKAGVPVGEMPIGGSESLRALGRKYMETLGQRPIEPTTGFERGLYAFGRGAAGAMAPAVAAETMLPKVAGLYPRFAEVAETLFAPRAAGVAPMAELAGLGGASGVGAETAMEMAPDRYKSLAGLAGGLAGGGLGAVGLEGSRVLPALARRGMEYLEPITERGVEQIAARRLGEAVESPLATIEAIETEPRELVAGSRPTTFELTGDMALGQAQRRAETMAPDRFLERRGEQAAARSEELAKVAPTGEITDLPTFLRQRHEELDANAARYVAEAEDAARREFEKLGGTGTSEDYGQILREKLEDAKSTMRKEREGLYKEVDPTGTVMVDASPIAASARTLSRQGPLAAPLSAVEKDIFDKAGTLGPETSFKDLRDFDTYVTAEMAAERRARGETPTWGRLSAVKSKIMDVLNESVESEALGAAKAKHAEYKQTFGRGPVGAALRTEGFAGQYRAPDAATVAKFFPAGEGGFEAASAFRKAIGDDAEALNTMQDYIVSSLRRKASDPKGGLDPAKFANWRRRHESALRAFPELSGRFDTALNAAERVASAAEATKGVIKEQQSKAVTSVMGLTNPDDVKRTIGSIFGQRNPVGQMKDLASKAQSPDARNGLRRAVAEFIRDKYISNAEAGTTGVNLIKSDAFQTFLRQNSAALREVFTPEEMSSMQRVAADLHRTNRSIRSTALPGRSTSAQDMLPAIKEKKVDLKSLFEVIVGGGGLAMMSSHPILGALSATSAAAHHVIEGLRHQGLQNVNDLVTEALLDPDVAKRLLQKLPIKPKEAAGGIQESLRRIPAYGLMGTTGDRQGFATGGAPRHREMTADMMIKAAERSKKKIQSDTKPILEEDDETVVSALRVANQHI
jgi:hypothetical protein